MNPNQLDPPASLGKSERSDRSKKVSLQPARLREFNNRILCREERFYAHWLAKSVTAAVDGGGRLWRAGQTRIAFASGPQRTPAVLQ
eukprot:COSAG01_NODE_2749_length_7147_cov_21.077185_3_plen_87_part_00